MSQSIPTQFAVKDGSAIDDESDSIGNRVVRSAKRRCTENMVNSAPIPPIVDQLPSNNLTVAKRNNKRQKVTTTIKVPPKTEEEHIQQITDLAGILPVEMWLEVIGWVDSTDLYNLYYTCTFFRDLKPELRMTALFPGVLQILHKQWTSHRDKLVIVKGIMLSCRLVCKSWNNSVNTVLSHYPITTQPLDTYFHQLPLFSRMSFNFTTFPIVFCGGLPSLSSIKKMKNILKYLENLEALQPNPFFNRHLVMDGLPHRKRTLEELRATTTTKTVLLKILKIVGPHIWHFDVHSYRNANDFVDDDLNDWWDMMLQCLSLLPNLKTIFIDWPNMHEFWNGRLKNLVVSTNGIPHLPHLEVFQTPSYWPANVLKLFLAKNSHVKKCNICLCLGVNWETSSEFWKWANFMNVSDFSLNLDFQKFDYKVMNGDVDSDGHFSLDYENSLLKVLEYVNWPLTQLVLEEVILSSEYLIKPLKRFGGSLTHLYVERIQKPKNGILEIAGVLKALPKLRHLEFDTRWLAESGEDSDDRRFQVDCLDGDVKFKVLFGHRKMVFRNDYLVVILNHC